MQVAPRFNPLPHTNRALLCHRCGGPPPSCAARTFHRPAGAPGRRPRLTGTRWDACTPQGTRNDHVTGIPGHCRTGFGETRGVVHLPSLEVELGCLQWREFTELSSADSEWPLHIAVLHDDIALVQRLCRLTRTAGASVDVLNSLRQTPITAKSCERVLPWVKRSWEGEGASVLRRDRNGNTALHLALKYPSLGCMRLVLAHRLAAKIVDAPDFDGYSPLHLAVLLNKPEAVSLLIKANCDINVPDGRSGRTPLYHAIALQREHLVKQLVSHGASTEAQDYAGHSCLALAKEAKSPCLPLLQGKGCSLSS
ncbi:hypothetical protein HPB51_014768 [Rhipicephalus microplus]|uniref:Uncharacterized protein n=1 Tax=Rhipicephalus microplus TaxID=6941 RepID=A0A9J6DN01_RHIMP|nr:hypothetical protein HPB51_014768 [Rhipicephalus microplus]